MGRSVDYLSNAMYKTFIPYGDRFYATCEHCGSTNVSQIEDADTDDGEDNYKCDTCDKAFQWQEPDHEFEWDYFECDLIETMQEICPSLYYPKSNKWDGRETKIILENGHAEIGISEYCGLVSISIREFEDDYKYRPGLSKHWIEQVWPKLSKVLNERYQTLRKVATFSNGEGVYERTK